MAEAMPATIYYPKAFNRNPAAGFDGVFDWEFLHSAFYYPQTRIKPMDVDAQVEHNHFFLKFETKTLGTPLPVGQSRAIQADLDLGVSTWVTIWGKDAPTRYEIFTSFDSKAVAISFPVRKVRGTATKDNIWGFCRRWYDFVHGLHGLAYLEVLEAAVDYHSMLPFERAFGGSNDFVVTKPLRIANAPRKSEAA